MSWKSVLTLACIVSGMVSANGQTIDEPLDREVALAGELHKVYGYGAPGYGENKKVDAPITYWVLELPNPIKVVCTPEARVGFR